MADISLREYLDKLDGLLGTPDEVIHHCRHILQYFPKNVATYRYLGRALLNSSGLEEAGEAFRRVLAVLPDDTAAHTSLSEVYQRTGKQNEAMYHAERAFEQEPHNKTLIDNLRELYRKYRQEEFAKLQLTTGAVAKQYVRNGLYSQAVDTLQTALERSPSRHDLRLLLARTLWDSNLKIEAAEEALTVLKSLPDCLEANRLLTQLWLEEGRPSDAQRYLTHIEAVDPYLALEIAQNAQVPDNAIKLPEADYGTVQRRRLETAQPDWLNEIGQQDDWMSAEVTQSPAPEDFAPSNEETFDLPVTDDWLAEEDNEQPALDDLFADAQPRSGVSGMLAALDEPQIEAQPSFDFDDVDLFAETGEEVAAANEEMPDWLNDSAPQIQSEADVQSPDIDSLDWLQDDALLEESQDLETLFAAEPPTHDENSPLAWLQGTDVEIVEEQAAAPDFFGDDEPMIYQSPDETNPLAWLEGANVEETPAMPDFTNIEAVDESDPLAWLQSGEDELTGEPSESLDWLQGNEIPEAPDAEITPTPAVSAVPQTDPLAWLQDDSMLDEALDIEQLTGQPAASISNLLSDQTDDAEVDTAARFGRTDLFPGHEEPALDNPERSDMNDQQLPDWLNSESDDEDSESDSFSWMNEQPAEQADDDEQALDWMMDVPEEPLAVEENAEVEALNNPEWLIEQPTDTPAPVSSEPDWLSETTAEPAEAAASSFEWLIEENEPTEQPAAAESGFEWLSGEEQPAASAESEFEWLVEEPTEPPAVPAAGGFDWLSEQPAEEDQPADVPDWLSASAPVAEEPQDEEPATQAETGFDWLSEQPAEDEEVQPVADVPDWLSASATGAEEPQDEEPATQAETGFDWLSEQPAEDEEVQPVADVPDWLSASAPVAEEPQDEEPAEEAQPADVPDWLSASAPVAEEPQEELEAASESGFEWLSAQTDDESAAGFEWLAEEESAEEAQPTADVPDWLSASSPVAENPQDEEIEGVTESDFEWLSGEAEEEQPVAAEAGIDWLSQPSDEEEPIASGTQWLSDEESFEDEEQLEAPMEIPDWMASSQPMSEPLEEEPAAQQEWQPEPESPEEEEAFSWTPDTSNEPDWLSELSEAEAQPEVEEIEEIQSAVQMPDWLSASEPAEEELQEEAYEWADEEEALEPAVDVPDWLNAAVPMAEASPEETAAEWLEDEGFHAEPEDEEERILAAAAAPPPAENAPDWLNAMVPGLDLDYEATEDEPVEREFITPAAQQPAGFDWLVRIVEEETSQFEPIRDVVQAVRRFVFKRQPAWLRTPTETGSRSPVAAETQADDDNEDFDLPDWLK